MGKVVYTFYGTKITRLNLVCAVITISMSIFWYSTNAVWSGNLLAYMLSILIITQISLDRFDIAFTIMWALFIFDIVMVF